MMAQPDPRTSVELERSAAACLPSLERHMNRVSLMAGQRTSNRRDYGSQKDAVGLYVQVRPEHRERAKQVARELDVPVAALVDMLLGALELDDRRQLVLSDQPAIPPRDQEALPLAG